MPQIEKSTLRHQRALEGPNGVSLGLGELSSAVNAAREDVRAIRCSTQRKRLSLPIRQDQIMLPQLRFRKLPRKWQSLAGSGSKTTMIARSCLV